MAEKTEPVAPKALVVRNLARDPQFHAMRRLRPGNKTGFMLHDGRRIRRKNVRGTELDPADVPQNAELLLDGVENGYIEVSGPTGEVLSLDEVRALAGGKPKAAKEAPKKPAKKPPEEPAEEKAPKKKKGLFGKKDKE